MSEILPTIWMNVTTSASWQRPPVGIVRVERSLCDGLARLYGSRFRQCVWQVDRFVEWVPQAGEVRDSEPKSQGGETQQVPKTAELPSIFPILPRRQALRAVGQGILSMAPSSFRPYLNGAFYRIRPHVNRFLSNDRVRKLMAKLRGKGGPHLGVMPAASKKYLGDIHSDSLFSRGDVFISVGLDWDYPFFQKFYFLRARMGVRVVTCCYDLIPVLYPQYCVGDVARKFESYFLDLADGSDLILCISRQSEKDLNDMLHRTGGARPLTHVFPLGDNVPLAAAEEVSQVVKEICKKPFILFVSTIERRKNHEVLYRAYHLLCSEGKREYLPKLVFVGMQGWGVNELMQDIELDPLMRGMIIRMNHVSDAELRSLYEAAKFCVFPSLYEGWGLPVGEALSLGKAVLSSGRGSLPEVGGDSVRYVDPWSPKAWADEIYKMSTDEAWRRSWEEKSKSEYRARTWSDAAISVKTAIDLIAR